MKPFLYQNFIFIFLLSYFSSIQAEIVTDGTVGAATKLAGPDFFIGQDLGTKAGNNLFHSFKTFDIKSNNGVAESATFTGSSDIKNVISRVTGGEISTINGLLKSEVGNADFYFLNPAGVIFRENAKVDVPAAFHISTADELQFDDDSIFSASNPDKSTLGMAQPKAFGLLSPQTVSIVVDGSEFDFQPKSNVSLTAGSIEIKNANIFNEAGSIHLVTQENNRDPILTKGALPKISEGNLIITSSKVDVSGAGGGLLNISAGLVKLIDSNLYNANLSLDNPHGETNIQMNNLQMLASSIQNNAIDEASSARLKVTARGNVDLSNNSKLQTATGGSGDAGEIDIKVKGLLKLQNGGRINSFTQGKGSAGSVKVKAGELSVDGKGLDSTTGILNDTGSSGNAGSISLDISGLLELINGATIRSNTYAQGNAGKVAVKADELHIDRQGSDSVTGILSDASTNSSGHAGSISLDISGLLELINGAIIKSNTYAQGNAGSVTVKAEELHIDRQGSDYLTGILSDASTNSSGDAGHISLNVSGLLELINGAKIRSNTFAQGNAGSVTVKADELRIDRQGSDYVTGILSESSTNLSGDAGRITLEISGLLKLVNGALIRSNTFSQRSAGSVTVRAGELHIDGQGSDSMTGILSDASVNSSGDAGTITLEISGLLELINGALISSTTFAQGNAGNLEIKAGKLRIDRQGADSVTGILSDASINSSGDAGTITLAISGLLELVNGATIRSLSNAQGNAGHIIVEADELHIDTYGSDYVTGISSDAEYKSSGDAGSIYLDISGLLELINGAQIRSATFAQGNAGSVTVKAEELRIDKQVSVYLTGISSQAAANASGIVGNININSNKIQLLNGGKLGISHLGTISDDKLTGYSSGELSITTNSLELYNESEIRASSFDNAPASNINLHINDSLLVTESSKITTSANTNNGGDINIVGNGGIVIQDGQITTSTNGGNGGDITINLASLAMDTGFIQANTDKGTQGGNISIDVPYLLTRNAILPDIGNPIRQEFIAGSGSNIIQAAAPEGNPGTLSLSSPEMDINTTIISLSNDFMDAAQIADDPCSSVNRKKISTLVSSGRGGVSSTPKDPSIVSFGGNRLDELLNNKTKPTGNLNKLTDNKLIAQYQTTYKNNRLGCLSMGQNY